MKGWALGTDYCSLSGEVRVLVAHGLHAGHVNVNSLEHDVFHDDRVGQSLLVHHLTASDGEAQRSQPLIPPRLLRILRIASIESLVDDGVVVHHFLVAFEDFYLHASNICYYFQL